MTTRRGRRVVDLTCVTFRQGAFLSKVRTLQTTVADGNKKMTYQLSNTGAGVCHNRALITMEVNPEPEPGVRPMDVQAETYIDMVWGLLGLQPDLELIGLWRKVIHWSDGDRQMEPVMRVALRRTPTVALHSLPGYANNLGIFDQDSAKLPVGTVWFSLQFWGRAQYCSTCKTLDARHMKMDCPKEPCRKCRELGHNSGNCPKGGRQPGAGQMRRARRSDRYYG